MSVGSPTAFLLWAILSVLFQIFHIVHLWLYDRFKCIRWHAGRQPGTFKRVMTYSYLATVPLLICFGVAMTVLKFKEGYVVLPQGQITPRPLELWRASSIAWVLPLYFVFSVGWSFELVTHLEEFAFWLFLLHQGPRKREWFRSGEFRLWYIGSMVAVVGMPLTTLITRRDLSTCLAWIFLVGSVASTLTNVAFIHVLFRFPGFLRYVKVEGAEPDVVVRLTLFFQLNVVRVVFRFMVSVPLLVLALDGIQGRHRIIMNPFWSDFMIMIAGLGAFVSSTITLLIFFPRSITKESGYKAKPLSDPSPSPKSVEAFNDHLPSISDDEYHHHISHPPTSHPASSSVSGSYFHHYPQSHPYSPGSEIMLDADVPPSKRASRRMVDVGVVVEASSEQELGLGLEAESSQHNNIAPPYRRRPTGRESQDIPRSRSNSNLHPYVTTFTSPIDFFDMEDDSSTMEV
ncbi:hypothetical protein JAAARDRAFT_158305 [Jaapia argillacea MUCL 33604]|uniref:Uncharacterized protein n=1 Tax=Jaapia argillacea MUCL 33604 TaxID=933084 RepID=A0A067PR52_9AGAM|nr:hypothetical protein JAAARDRAFT_158305 [Jaapia argillacea MUCL 33604]